MTRGSEDRGSRNSVPCADQRKPRCLTIEAWRERLEAWKAQTRSRELGTIVWGPERTAGEQKDVGAAFEHRGQ